MAFFTTQLCGLMIPLRSSSLIYGGKWEGPRVPCDVTEGDHMHCRYRQRNPDETYIYLLHIAAE